MACCRDRQSSLDPENTDLYDFSRPMEGRVGAVKIFSSTGNTEKIILVGFVYIQECRTEVSVFCAYVEAVLQLHLPTPSCSVHIHLSRKQDVFKGKIFKSK